MDVETLRKNALDGRKSMENGRPEVSFLKLLAEVWAFLEGPEFPSGDHWFCNDHWRPLAELTLVYSSFTDELGKRYFAEMTKGLSFCARCVRIYHQLVASLIETVRRSWGLDESFIQKFEQQLLNFDKERLDGALFAGKDATLVALYDCLYCPRYMCETSEKNNHILSLMVSMDLISNTHDDLFEGGTPLGITWLYSEQEDARDYAKCLFKDSVVAVPIKAMDTPTLKEWHRVLQEQDLNEGPKAPFWNVTSSLVNQLTVEFLGNQLHSHLQQLVAISQRVVNIPRSEAFVQFLGVMFAKFPGKGAIQALELSQEAVMKQLCSAPSLNVEWMNRLIDKESAQKDNHATIRTLLSVVQSTIVKKETLYMAMLAAEAALDIRVSTAPPVAQDYSCLLRGDILQVIHQNADQILSAVSSPEYSSVQDTILRVIQLSIQLDLANSFVIPEESKQTTKSTLWSRLLESYSFLLKDPKICQYILGASTWITPFLIKPADRKNQREPRNQLVTLMMNTLNTMCNSMYGPTVEKVLSDKSCLTAVFMSCFAYDERLQAAAVDLLSQGFDDVGSRQVALRTLLRKLPKVTLESFTDAITICRNLGQYTVSLRYVRIARDFLDALYGHDGAVDDDFKAKLGDADLYNFWLHTWELQEMTCRHTRQWGTKYYANEVKGFFCDEAEYCQALLDTFRMVEADIPPSVALENESIGIMLARPVAKALEAMCDLLKLRDVILVQACFDNFIRILELMRSFNVPVPEELAKTLVQCASRDISTNLSEDNCQHLFDSLIKSDILSESGVQALIEQVQARRKRSIEAAAVTPSPSTEAPPVKKQKLVNDFFQASEKYIAPASDISRNSVEPSAPSRTSQLEALRAELKIRSASAGIGAQALSKAAAKPIKDVHPARPPGFNSKLTATATMQSARPTANMPYEISESESDSDMDGLFKENPKPSGVSARNISRPDFQMNSAMVGQRNRAAADATKNEENALRIRLNVDCTDLHKKILTWEYFQSESDSPVPTKALKAITDKYSDVKSYQSALSPLLLLECWYGIQKAKTENVGVMKPFFLEIGRRERCDAFTDVHASLEPSVLKNHKLSEADLIVIWPQMVPKQSPCPLAKSYPHCYARIQTVRSHRDYVDVTLRTYEPKDILTYLSKGTRLNAMKVSSLVTVEREYSSLEGLPHYDLRNAIINGEPRPIRQHDMVELEGIMDKFQVNKSQAEAIVDSFQGREGFQLIQGYALTEHLFFIFLQFCSAKR